MDMKTILHQFRMGDCEDLDIYVAEPIWQWQQTDAGKWCMTHAKNISWTTGFDLTGMGYRVTVVGDLEEANRTFFELKYREQHF